MASRQEEMTKAQIMGRDGTWLRSMSKRRNDLLTRVHCSGQAVIWLNKLVNCADFTHTKPSEV